MNRLAWVNRKTVIGVAVAGIFVLASGLYVGFESLSAVRRMHTFYNVEVFGLREGGQLAFNMQESRRIFVYALTTTDANLQLTYIDQARSSDEDVDHTVAQLSALPFDRRCRRTLADLVQGWKSYLAI